MVLLDYHLPGADGLKLCRRLKREVPAPAVLLYSAYADSSMVVPAILAGADGLPNKSAPAPASSSTPARGWPAASPAAPVPRELLESAGHRVDPSDLPILAMMVDGTPVDEIAEAMRVPTATFAPPRRDGRAAAGGDRGVGVWTRSAGATGAGPLPRAPIHHPQPRLQLRDAGVEAVDPRAATRVRRRLSAATATARSRRAGSAPRGRSSRRSASP